MKHRSANADAAARAAAASKKAANQSTDVLFLPHFPCTLEITFISIWATRRKIVNMAVITLALLPFLNNANFKGF